MSSGPRRVCVILNPHAGQANDQAGVQGAIELWQAHGWQVELQPSAYAGHAIELARAAAEQGYDLVVAAGGDGTVNEVVNGLAGSATVMGAIPVGTGNVWVRELKLPLAPLAAAESMLSGHVHTLDLGMAGDRYFLLMAGIGFDAEVTRRVDPVVKRRLGLGAYVLHAFAAARGIRGTPIRLLLDGRPVKGRALMVVIGNSRLYGGFLQIAHQASPVDGLLDVVVIKGGDARVAPLHLLSILLRQHHFNPDIDYYRARELTITSRQPLDVQVDGDTIAQTPLTFRVVPGALRALMPAGSFQRLTTPALGPTARLWHAAQQLWQRTV